MTSESQPMEGDSATGFSGGCACGAVRYEIAAQPVRAFQCQCKDCQRDTGGGHASVLVFPRAALQIAGPVREISRQADSGARKTKGFCVNCGAPLYNKPEEKPEFIGIYVGSLDDASGFRPEIVLFCSRGYAWDRLDPDLPKRPEWHSKPQK